MNAVLSLSDQERARVRGELFRQKRKDYLLMAEITQESKSWHTAYVNDDPIAMRKALDDALRNYLVASDGFGEAERDYLSSKIASGKMWLEA